MYLKHLVVPRKYSIRDHVDILMKYLWSFEVERNRQLLEFVLCMSEASFHLWQCQNAPIKAPKGVSEHCQVTVKTSFRLFAYIL